MIATATRSALTIDADGKIRAVPQGTRFGPRQGDDQGRRKGRSMSSAQQAVPAVESPTEEPPLRICVERAVGRYLEELGGFYAGDMHRLVIEEVERPLLEQVLAHVGGNQTQAAEILGINRATLRKKLRHYKIGG